jgi:hypothetical protein
VEAQQIAVSELNARPVAFTPMRRLISSGPNVAHTSANTKGFATLMIVNSTSASPTPYTPPRAPTTQIPKSSGGAWASAG